MKKLTSLLINLIAVTMALPAFSADNPINLSFTSVYNDRHDIVQYVYRPWIEEVKERSHGRLIITYYNPNTLCPDVELLDSYLRGQVSLGSAMAARNPGRLPLNALPYYITLRFDTSTAATTMYQELLKLYPQFEAELKGIKLLWVHTTAPNQFHSPAFAINARADLQGRKIISSTTDGMRNLKGLGANGIMIPTQDIYLSLSRGMADGVTYPIAAMRSFKLDEITKYHSMANLFVNSIWGGISQQVFDSLPQDLQNIILETSRDIGMRCAAILDAADVNDRRNMEANGHIFNEIAAEEIQLWRSELDRINLEFFLSEMEKRSRVTIDAAEVFNKALELSEQQAQ